MSLHAYTKYLLFLALAITSSMAYNLDVDRAKIYEDPSFRGTARNSYFGYSVALYVSDKETILLVGAPKANSSRKADVGVVEPGAVFKCSIKQSNTSCEEWLFDASVPAKLLENTCNWQIKQNRSNSWLGASIAVTDTSSPKIAVIQFFF